MFVEDTLLESLVENMFHNIPMKFLETRHKTTNKTYRISYIWIDIY